MNLNEVVNIREGKDGKILVSSMDSGKVKVRRFFLDQIDLGNYLVDAVYSEQNGERKREVVETVNLIRLRSQYPDLNEEGVKKLKVYLVAREYAARIAEQRNATLIDRTQGLNDLPYASEHLKRREKAYGFLMKRRRKIFLERVT